MNFDTRGKVKKITKTSQSKYNILRIEFNKIPMNYKLELSPELLS